MTQILKIISIFLLWTAISIFGGWKVNTYYQGYQNNLKQEVTQTIKDSISDMQAGNAKQLTSTLNELKGLDIRVIKESKTIIERPIYQNQCMDEDGLSKLKQYKEKSNEIRTK